MSFPHRVRWGLLKEKGLLSDVLTLFLRAVSALQRLGLWEYMGLFAWLIVIVMAVMSVVFLLISSPSPR
ncbi:hypothetical protein [Corallococcus exiguus]|uniref:hypothetical protein n=1 Tax=Corallococcus exiguus TaxID=83462 RepID=UPI001494CFEE|nr:hypothetical protein [Corallococcus exiguus]NPD29459.1 hypothetical protein [Corallococcus exiguus]